ncbi:type III glutamate--ammonia ligase [Actinoplanes siamensis]|uniref:Glutamine synthetase n=1 Tax=Actinoplanes siamensis TaxID=1223317 RepID=A0A919TM27_9ACTN|nr:type III glutamate--ammonia ligase [Actinoplanes siamensis]GIF07104.1 glutamine synthetase [Actinoplanes siamensis]
MSTASDDLAGALARDGIEHLLVMFVNLHGKPCAKLAPVETLDELLRDGLGFAGHAADGLGQGPQDPDVVAVPDATSYLPVPLRPGLGIIQCDLFVEGEPWPYSPRGILRAQLGRLAERDRVARIGAEPEYFLVRRDADGTVRVADPQDTAASPCYDAYAATRSLDHLVTLSRTMNQWGWGNYSNDHEDANGQFEQNFGYAEALVTADRVVAFRYLARMAAERDGLIATFMPKPFTDLTGSGLHLHLSLATPDGARATFEPGDGPDRYGLGLSEEGYHFVGGVLAHAPGLHALTSPTVNSYKRIGAVTTRSGASWAPGYASYGGNNRTHLVRVPAPGRIEVRCVDAAANPYLAAAGIIAAGLDGLEQKRDPGAPVEGDPARLTADEAARAGLRPLPPTLLHAADALAADEALRAALGKVPGGEYADYYAQAKRAEFAEYHRQVSRWEWDRYL